jgi:ABC-2 type transport system permease protein
MTAMTAMLQSIRRKAGVYSAIAAIVPKIFMAYRAWFWMGILLNTISMTIFVFFWRAVYSNTSTIAGLNLQQTLNYILLAQVLPR